MFNRRNGSSAAPAIMPRDLDDVGASFSYSTGHGAMPIIETSLTLILALGLMAFRSKMSCAKSSIE